ncbi:serine/threonine protein kinase, partial [Streptomyces sp. DH24]|nr:serine/threonine protein kinase [Streptomyces sp. DH24]
PGSPHPGPAYGFPHQPAPAWPGSHDPGASPQPYGTPEPSASPQPYGTPEPSASPQPYGTPASGTLPPQFGTPAPGGPPQHYGTPPAGTPPHRYDPHGSGPAYGPPPETSHGSSRSSVLLVVVALVVALAAGGSVYALMNRGDQQSGGGPAPSPTVTGEHQSADPAPSGPDPGPTTGSPSPSADGAIPAGYLGTWTTTIDNASGQHTRRLTIQQGEVGDTVLSLAAEGPADNGSDYRCVFVAELSEKPGAEGPLAIGPSSVRTGQPSTACAPGAATDVTLLPDGTLERVNPTTGERLVYRRE